MGGSRKENVSFSLKWGTCKEKTCHFHVTWGIL
ncbi:hypothetical protein CP10743SC13_1870, partial [Chlamydia psittaci 10_743_SC13]